MRSPDPAGSSPSRDVYVFATCVVDLFMPDAGLDAIAVLERLGCRVHFPDAQTCCGQPAYTSGFPEEARRVAAAQLDLFPQRWPIVVPSGSCAGMMRHHWPRLFEHDAVRLAQARDIAARVVEFTDFLATTDLPLPVACATDPVSICLHTSCSARRETCALASGRRLLEALPGVDLKIQAYESECCGFGGTFAVKQPEISAAMAGDKADALTDSGCDAFVSGDCGCLLNLNGTLARREGTLQGRHIASFLRERWGLPAPGDST